MAASHGLDNTIEFGTAAMGSCIPYAYCTLLCERNAADHLDLALDAGVSSRSKQSLSVGSVLRTC